MDALSQETIATIVAGTVIAGFLWSLHRDIAGLRVRISRMEALYEGLRDSVAALRDSVNHLERRLGRLEQKFDDRFPPPSVTGG